MLYAKTITMVGVLQVLKLKADTLFLMNQPKGKHVQSMELPEMLGLNAKSLHLVFNQYLNFASLLNGNGVIFTPTRRKYAIFYYGICYRL